MPSPTSRKTGPLISVLVTVFLLCVTDVAVISIGMTGAFADRLPEHFSAYHLKHYVEQGRSKKALLVLGDSVLWGYGLPVERTAVAKLRERFPRTTIINAAYEAGSPINNDFLLRYLLADHIYPRAVLFDLNPLSFNQFAKSYNTLNPALEFLALPSALQPFDQNRLLPIRSGSERAALWTRVDDFLEMHWALYGSRVDIHQFLFRDADAATALHSRLEAILQGSRFDQHRVTRQPGTPYAEMYDLTPLDLDNVSYAYTQHLLKLLNVNGIPAIAIITPSNHVLLHKYIDVPAYTANIRRLESLCHKYRVTVLNLDRRIPQNQFIDNTHLTAKGNQAMARMIAPAVARALHVF